MSWLSVGIVASSRQTKSYTRPVWFSVGCLDPSFALTMLLLTRYGDGTLRLCVEQDVLFPNIPEDKLEAFQADLLFQRFSLNPAGAGLAAGFSQWLVHLNHGLLHDPGTAVPLQTPVHARVC